MKHSDRCPACGADVMHGETVDGQHVTLSPYRTPGGTYIVRADARATTDHECHEGYDRHDCRQETTDDDQ